MAPVALPPGFRFHPSDEELLSYYLKRKIHGRKIELDIIPEVDLYKCEPWDLPNKSFLPNRDLEWYFFSPRDRKYPNGSRTNRATEAGYWKATGKDRKTVSQLGVMGTRKTLVFYMGRAPRGRRTDWVMHEYRLDEVQCEGAAGLQDAYVLCRVFKKNGIEKNNGAQIDKIILSSSMDYTFSENMASFSVVQERSEKSCSQIRQDESSIRANLTLSPEESSSETPNDRNGCNAFRNGLLEFESDDAIQNCNVRSPENFTNDLKVSSTLEDARIQQDSAHPMLKVEDFPECLGDVSLNMPGAMNGSRLSKKIYDPCQEDDIVEAILNVVQASQDCNSHLEHSFSLNDFADNSIRESLLENCVPYMGDSYGIFMVKEVDGSPSGERELREYSQTSTWNRFQEILPGQV